MLVLHALAPTGAAQNARVVVASSSNGQIFDVSFQPPGSTVLNTDANAHVSLQSVVFREDGAGGLQLLAADRLAGQVIFYSGSSGDGQIVLDEGVDPDHPRYPNGLSLDSEQNLYGVTSWAGGSPSSAAKVWALLRDEGCAGCLPGGYDSPVGYLDRSVQVDTDVAGVPVTVEVQLLEESLVVTSNSGALSAGDVLVLSSTPAMLLRYAAVDVQNFLVELAEHAAGGPAPAEIDPEVFIHPWTSTARSIFPFGSRPRGMDFTPAGNLLISSSHGVVLSYASDGTRLPDFATALGIGKFKLATGFQDGEPRVFLADRNGGELLRFTIEADGTGTMDASVANLQSPLGVATTTASDIPVPAGRNVTVEPSNLLSTTVEEVLEGGVVSAQAFIFTDPREAEASVGVDEPLHRPLRLGEISSLLPAGYEIPAYVRSFRKGDPLTGDPTFILLVVDATVDPFGILLHHGFEEVVLGYDPNCDDPDPTQQPRIFWAPSPPEPLAPGDRRFSNVSAGCGSSVGMTRNWSLFLIGARDTRPLDDIAGAQLDGLGLALAVAQCVSAPTLPALAGDYDRAVRAFDLGQTQKAIDDLNSFLTTANGSPEAFDNCTLNVFGDLKGRANASIFALTKLL